MTNVSCSVRDYLWPTTVDKKALHKDRAVFLAANVIVCCFTKWRHLQQRLLPLLCVQFDGNLLARACVCILPRAQRTKPSLSRATVDDAAA
jgi:hypothetical protein